MGEIIMWDQWKEKLKNLFREDTDEHDAANKKDWPNKGEVHSKVMYHYPKRTSFRFPVIPDEQQEKVDTPAYKRREIQREKKESQPTNQSDTTSKEERKTTNIPFRPSKVASPIFGYQERKENDEIANVPAYIRKQEESNIEHEPTSDKSDEIISTEAYVVDTYRSEEQVAYENTPLEQNVDNEEAKTQTSQQSSKSNQELMEETNNQSLRKEQNRTAVHTRDSEKKGSIRKNKKQQSSSTKKNRNNEQQPVPFNVMMSHNDKQHMKQSTKHQTVLKNTQTSFDKQPAHAYIPYHLLNDKKEDSSADRLWVRNQQELLEKTLSHFKVDASVVNATQGPSVTRFEVQPALGVKVSKVKNLNDDIKLNLAAKDIRIEAPIPGKHTIGIEIPNPNPQIVGLQEIFESDTFKSKQSPLSVALGLTIEGNPAITNIQKMPHGLIAGATGSGKSVCINTILISLLYKADHESVKFLLIDPKMVELAPYNGIPNLISPVITDVKAATMALKWAVKEMEERYDKFVQEGTRDIERYNAKMMKEQRKEEKMPYIVIVIDELADLMMVSPQDVEDAICRIAQKARACGIHLLLATQRPSVDVITGLIKANIPTRIAFSVSSQVDSRTVIDTSGAEKLLGKGDMLFVENGAGKSVRLQGAFVSDEEIERVTDYARSIANPQYEFEQEQLLEKIHTDDNEDELLETAIEFVVEQHNASTSLLQRHFKIGYNRAARLMDAMAQRGIISEQNGSKPRDILVSATSLSND